MKKQSSVDWLISCITEDQMIKAKSLNEWLEIFEQAKAMHELEIMNAYLDGDSNGCGCYDYSTEEDAKEYYNSTNFIKDGAEQD